MPSFRDGSTNILALSNPGTYVDNILPTPFIKGVPTNIEGMVGVGSWGPANSRQYFSTPDDCAGLFGVPMVRPYDLPTYVQTAVQMGTSVGFCGVRVTDGTDTAASAAIPGAAGTMSAKYTGSRGSLIAFSFQKTTAIGAFAAVILFPGRTPERFDNIFQALCAINVVPGSGYTSVPTLLASAPTGLGAVPATIRASLIAVSVALAANGGGTGHAVNDLITFGAGVTAKVTTVAAGVVTGLQLVSPGSIASGAVPGTVGAQVASSGSGLGANAAIVFGLGPATFTSGFGYKQAPTIAMAGGGSATQAGSYTPVVSFWAALAYAIANGTAQRGPSSYVIFSPGNGTAAPTLNAPVTLVGGTDGAAGITTADLIGVDIAPRTGMYALRSTGCSDFALCDLTDPSTCATQIAFGISEAMMPIFATASGDTIEGAVAARANDGVDDPNLWFIEGDWPTVYDAQNGLNRLVSPQAIAVGLCGNLSPEQSPINKPLGAVIATESSMTGVTTADADESQAQTGGIDLIGRSDDLGATYFSFLTGRNASSNTAANGVEYSRLTNYLTRSLQGVATRSVVGKLQSVQVNDPTRIAALSILNSFLQNLASTSAGSGGYGMIDSFSVQCDLSNNPPSLQALGFLFAFVTVRYLNVVRYFVIKLSGGGNVTVSVQDTAPTVAQLAA